MTAKITPKDTPVMDQRCEVCGEAAMAVTIDLRDITEAEDEWRRFEIYGQPHARCINHERESKVVDPYTDKLWYKDMQDAMQLDGYRE